MVHSFQDRESQTFHQNLVLVSEDFDRMIRYLYARMVDGTDLVGVAWVVAVVAVVRIVTHIAVVGRIVDS
jgi:hypothetical protein